MIVRYVSGLSAERVSSVCVSSVCVLAAGEFSAGSSELGSSELGSAELGDSEPGSSELGDTELGSSEWGTAESGPPNGRAAVGEVIGPSVFEVVAVIVASFRMMSASSALGIGLMSSAARANEGRRKTGSPWRLNACSQCSPASANH